jgi:hypothetical protein
MRVTRPRWLTVACLLTALAAGACGNGERSTPTTPAETPVGPVVAAVRILSPERGSSLRASRVSADQVSADVTVTGDAENLQSIRVDGRCPARSCSKVVYTGASGRWTARLRLILPPRARRWTLTADYAVTSAAGAAARVSVGIRAAKSRSHRRRRRSAPQSQQGAGTTTQRPPSSTATTPASPAPSGRARSLVLVGDSLAVGVRTLLAAQLPGWKVEVLGRVGRPLAEGMSVLEGLGLSGSSPVVAISLFTNDDPTHTSALEAAARRTLDLVGARGCAIWATIARPPVNGVSYRAANAILERLAATDGRLRVVPWAEQVAANSRLLGADGVHPTPAGYELRARLYAQAAQACP